LAPIGVTSPRRLGDLASCRRIESFTVIQLQLYPGTPSARRFWRYHETHRLGEWLSGTRVKRVAYQVRGTALSGRARQRRLNRVDEARPRLRRDELDAGEPARDERAQEGKSGGALFCRNTLGVHKLDLPWKPPAQPPALASPRAGRITPKN
jgi:hypothetical protein